MAVVTDVIKGTYDYGVQKVHRIDPAPASNVVRKKWRAPAKAIRLIYQTLRQGQADLQHLGLFARNLIPGLCTLGIPSINKQPPLLPPWWSISH